MNNLIFIYLFFFHIEISQPTMFLFIIHYVFITIGKPSMSRGALMRFCKVETYGARIIEYMFFSQEIEQNQNSNI
jgi:hypothetical protein